MKIHALYSLPHYGEHLDAICKHLPEELRGHDRMGRHIPHSEDHDDLVMVAGFGDLPLARGRRTVLVEHGAGQRYLGLDPRVQSYYGGPYPDNVIAYLGPRQSCVDDVGLPGFAMGSPVCDPYDLFGEDRVCAITWHWRGRRVSPEADSALPHYVEDLDRIIKRLQRNGWEVLGHRHPRLRTGITIYERLGIDEVEVSEVRNRASLLLADNTSLAYEMAYLCRRNICLNAPWYRRDVEHGLRFWDQAPGPMVDDADELLALIDAFDETPFPHTSAYERDRSDGNDGIRAAAWLTAFAAGL